MIRSSLNLMVLLITWITIFFLTSLVSGLGIFTHNETNPFETEPWIWNYVKYLDGTVVIRIINLDPNKTQVIGEAWTRPVLSLRIIHSNGTVSEIDKDLEIPEFNWHITTSPNGDTLDRVNIYALQKGYLLITYFNAYDINTYEEGGRIINWNGTLYDKVNFPKTSIENGTWNPSVIVTNVDPKKEAYVVPNVDGGYSIIMGNYTDSSNFGNNNPLEIRAAVYALTKRYDDKQFSAPKMLYQLPLDNITISRIAAGISSTGIGQVCILTIRQNNVDYYVKLNFLSSGSITEIVPLNITVPELPKNVTTGWTIESIPYGGYVYYCRFLNEDNRTNVYGYYFNEIENNFMEWDFPEPSVFNVLIILPNNTMLISQLEDLNAWSFNTTDIPKFTDKDNDYSNFQVKSSNPSINANIPTSTDMSNITITYYEPVERSYGNISIYQIDKNGNNIIRQFVNGVNSFCSISDNGLTVTVKVIKSTFSNPNSQFYVKVDNDFVRSKAYRESLKGIYNIWKFNTSSNKETFADKVYGVLRLTKEGTEYYENLNPTGKNKFFTDLRLELSEIIPINNIKRLSSNGKSQVDTVSHQTLISLNIESSSEERSVASIVDDLNDMIVYKNMTSIGLKPTTKYLDGDYGFKPNQNLWDKYKWKFLGVILILAILVVLFLIAQKMESKGRNIAVLQLGLIIFDFVMDVLFVSKNGKVIKELYIPSVLFVTIPIGINAIWAFYIISDENKSKNFLNWFTQHEKAASIFTILSSADIETLRILYSNLAGFKFFQAPISTKGKNRIFWASCITIFIEDIPQVIIQLVYHFSVVTYDDIIPILALASSCLNLLTNFIGRLFQAINNCRHGTLEYENTQNREDFQKSDTERNFTSDKSISHSIDRDPSNRYDTNDSLDGFQEIMENNEHS
ncbi:7568_t:CDS:10 [Diversispora eburnea]|uniref:7568_t:CDS:1 n=1 Tax=Diversispora eburnea TaxID=1213867 RepID=A0A9N9G268_9GLOM|nr:7568_t:CDS:10 [Diversispora eburnea]